jgi:hypothetical protein
VLFVMEGPLRCAESPIERRDSRLRRTDFDAELADDAAPVIDRNALTFWQAGLHRDRGSRAGGGAFVAIRGAAFGQEARHAENALLAGGLGTPGPPGRRLSFL